MTGNVTRSLFQALRIARGHVQGTTLRRQPTAPASSVASLAVSSSAIVSDNARPTKRSKANFSKFQNAQFVRAIYDGFWPGVPFRGLDNLRYFATTVGELRDRCPNLGKL